MKAQVLIFIFLSCFFHLAQAKKFGKTITRTGGASYGFHSHLHNQSSAAYLTSNSLLHIASDKGLNAAILFLISVANYDPNAPNGNGDTPLYLASRSGHIEAVESLLISGANMDALNNNSDTSLHAAVRNGHVVIAEFLILLGADISIQNESGITPLNIAFENNLPSIIRLIAKKEEGIQN